MTTWPHIITVNVVTVTDSIDQIYHVRQKDENGKPAVDRSGHALYDKIMERVDRVKHVATYLVEFSPDEKVWVKEKAFVAKVGKKKFKQAVRDYNARMAKKLAPKENE